MKMRMIFTVTLALLLLTSSCGKDFLDEKRDKNQVVPSAIADFQALLDDASRTMNTNSGNELELIGADEYFISDQAWEGLPANATAYERKGYYWAKDDVYEKQQVRDWNYAYRKILYANTALEGIEEIAPKADETAAWNNVKGSALFFRAFNFYQLAQVFCKPFDASSASADPGIPLRLKPDITAPVTRATVSETYARIIEDLKNAAGLLPELPLVKYRPSKAGVYALLAKTYLVKEDYENAERYADSSLHITNSLIDFNTLNLTVTYPFPTNMQNNPEIIFISYILNIPILQTSRMRINPELYASYDDNDLGKNACFLKNADGYYTFRGSYYGSQVPMFTGLSTDEVLLIKAECAIRNGSISEALSSLNYLLQNRYDRSSFTPVAAANAEELLKEIIDQRRKRLLLRGTRWEDLRRLNKDPRFAQTLVRVLKGVRYELPPGDLRYVWPLPDNVIEISGLEQNPR